jgi:hypothetical protein
VVDREPLGTRIKRSSDEAEAILITTVVGIVADPRGAAAPARQVIERPQEKRTKQFLGLVLEH